MNEFKNLDELYKGITPALKSKCREFHAKGYHYIKEVDIWNYLSKYIWNTSKGLDISEMVDNILNVNDDDVSNYVLRLLGKEKREKVEDLL